MSVFEGSPPSVIHAKTKCRVLKLCRILSVLRAFTGALVCTLAALIGPVHAQIPASPPGVGPEVTGFEEVTPAVIARGLENLEQLEGLPIRAVSVEELGKLWRGDPPALTTKLVGEPLGSALARAALREILASGRYAQAYADARPYEGGAILRLVALPRRIIAGIKLTGGSLEQRRTLAAAEIAEGDEVTEAGLGRVVAAVQKHYARSGYYDAKVDIQPKDTADEMQVLLEMEIEPGERRKISRRIFVIEPKFDQVLGKNLKQEYEVETGDPVDEDELREADNDMAELLRAAGFLHATVKHRLVRRDTFTFLYVYLETGPLYEFVFSGNVRHGDDDLVDALELDAPVLDASSEALGERITRYYKNRGFYDARVTVQLTPLGKGAVNRVRFDIVEGDAVRVKKRLFPCLPAEAVDDLGADDLGDDLDATLAEELPSMPLLHEIDEQVFDGAFSGGGSRPEARQLEAALTYTPEAYEKALAHLEEVLHSKGYLDAVVGPLSVIRAECDPYARGGKCVPLALPPYPAPKCATDALNLPVAEAPLGEAFTCTPDPARSIRCAPTMVLNIPVQLGPKMRLYDVVFEGNKLFEAQDLLEVAAFPLGSAFSGTELDAAQARILNAYKDRGYAYATVRTTVDYSPDRTRARARFVISEHKPVIIDEYEVRGAVRTDPELILSRLALCRKIESGHQRVFVPACEGEERYYKRNLVRESEEQIATLGTFSSVSIALEDPHVPQEQKRVIITVSELTSQYIEPSLGFYTGDGIRGGFEYGHRNIGGQAIALTVRLEFAFLPEFLILNEDVKENYADFTVSERLERRNTGSLRFPDVGLGPKVDVVINGVDARDNQRDFGITREALFPTINWRPIRNLSLQLGVSAELNDVTLFGADDVESAIRDNPSLANLLRVPDGRTIAFAQRLAFTWDGRNKPLAATSGTLLTSTVEHVSAFPLEEETEITSEFIKVRAQGAGYIPLGDGGIALAMSLAGGINIQLESGSKTYPDRLFYLGGVNTIRGFQLDEVVPEDIAQQIVDGSISIDDVGVRGGDIFVNPRLELRIPLNELLSTGIFLDTGNLWSQADSIDEVTDLFKLRYTAGAGLRIETPLGPIAFDAGFKLVRYEWEELFAAHFSIGLF